MASAIPGVRFVRCPKCDKVLAEFGQVPVYRCGGCGTVLRAKARASTAETTVRGSALEKDSQTPTETSSSISSFVNKSASSANQTDTSLEVGNGMQRVAQSDHHPVLNSNADSDSNGKEELTEKGKNRTKERRHEDSSSAVTAENLPEKGNQVREMESSLQDLHDSSLNEKKEESSYRVDNDIKFTSLAYDASDSSRDEQPLSRRRRVRHEKAPGKDGSTEKGTPQPRTRGIPAELQNEMSYATRRRRSLERDTTFGSADFHSVQNWMGSEIDDEDLITLSKELLFPGDSEPDHMKILRKVDELRDELREFLTKTSEGKKQDPHFKPREKPKLPPRVPKVPSLPTQNGESEKCRKAAKKKQTTIKQYFRPVCGGAPFVICYKCWTLLQLPADFLVSGKTLHKLQCGACSEVLVFSFRSRGRADAPLTPTEAQHPPSEVDARADPISPSSESCSSELNEHVQNVSRSSSYSSLRQGRLHRLLGYSSASDILFRHEGGYVDGGSNSSETSTPQFYRPPRDDRRRRYGQYGGTGTGTSRSPEIQEVEESSSPRRRGSAIGLLKKGMREFSHGLENVKLKVHSRG